MLETEPRIPCKLGNPLLKSHTVDMKDFRLRVVCCRCHTAFPKDLEPVSHVRNVNSVIIFLKTLETSLKTGFKSYLEFSLHMSALLKR